MANTSTIDLKFYWAVFLRRLPYFLVVAALFTAAGTTVAMVLPAVYRSTASILVEPQQIADPLAEATVANNPYQQAQIIEQRLMTRANLLELANRLGLYKNLPEPMSANAIVGDMRTRIEFIGFIPDVTQMRGIPGATILGVAFQAETAEMALKGSNELVNLVLQENVRLRTGRAGDTLEFFTTEVDRLSQALETQAARIADFKTANVSALPDSMDSRRAQQEREQQRLLDLEREEAQLRNQRATVEWVYQRTGRAQGLAATTPEEDELQRLQRELLQAQAIYKPTSPQVRILQNRIAALQGLVDQQRAARALPDADGNAAAPLTELGAELAPIDDRLKFIAEERATIQGNLSTLDSSIQATPENEMVLSGLERELTALQEQYKAAVAAIARAAGIRQPHAGRVHLTIRLYPHRPQDWAKRARKDPYTWDDTVQCIDLGNCEKVLSDALNGVAWVDDKKHRRILQERMEPDEKGARVEVEIEFIAAAPSLLDEVAA